MPEPNCKRAPRCPQQVRLASCAVSAWSFSRRFFVASWRRYHRRPASNRLAAGCDNSNRGSRRVLFHHLVGRHWAPQVRGVGRFGPGLRALRIVPMPRPRIEVAERFVLHLVEFGEQLRDQAVRGAMIGKEIVADAVPPRPPENLVAVLAQKIAGALHMWPIAQFER